MTDPRERTPKNPEGLRDLPFPLPRVSAAKRERAAEIDAALAERYPDAHCALDFSTPHELLIATILSAQTTDANVNKATPALFKAFPTPEAYARAGASAIEPYVQSLGFFRNKARAIAETMQAIVEQHGGEVPRTMDELLALRGVARKTANVVLGNAFGINAGFVVDTHIERLSKRFGLAPRDATVTMVERYLCAQFPREHWCILSHRLIWHGRAVCKARGWLCEQDEICRRFCSNARGGSKSKKKTTKKAASKKSGPKKAASKKKTARRSGRSS
ncbi:MAG: endonuclease III [Phycisphaerales bacterium]